MSNTEKGNKSNKTENFKNITTIIANFVTIIGVIALFYTYYSYKVSVNSLHQTSINSCMTRFTELRPELKNIKTFNKDYIDSAQSNIIDKYLDLCEEELFYIQHDIVPDEIALDWVSGMIDFFKGRDFKIEQYSSYHRKGWNSIQNKATIKKIEEENEKLKMKTKRKESQMLIDAVKQYKLD